MPFRPGVTSTSPGLALLLASLALPAGAAVVRGTLTDEASGAPLAAAWVGASRLSSVAATAAEAPIAVEWSVQTTADGTYALDLGPAGPGHDRVLIFTWSHLHFNELLGGVDASGTTPHGRDLAAPGLITLDVTTGDRAGIDFALAGNRRVENVLMRDGAVHLATDVVLPSRVPGLRWPTILYRTPYDKSRIATPRGFVISDYAVVLQDMRGRFASEGVDEAFDDDGWGANQDGYDAIEWVAVQAWCNGKVGTYGGSALGISQLRAAGASPPHHVCAVPEIAAFDHYRDFAFPGGAFLSNLVDTWLAGQGSLHKLDDYVAHSSRDDYWDALDMGTRLADVHVPMLHVGGWHDLFAQGTLDAFTRLQEEGGAGARRNQKMVMGPWTHGRYFNADQGELTFPSQSLFYDYFTLLFDWYEFWMKGVDNGVMDGPPARYYTMGPGLPEGATAPGNIWRYEAAWPPPATDVALYLQPGGALGLVPATGPTSSSYDFDPANPVPTRGGQNLYVTPGPYDNATVDTRPDVLTFQTVPLPNAVEITGHVEVVLFASSDRLDTDWMVKLEDVQPDGRVMLVTDQALRSRHRVSMRQEDFLVPGEVTELHVDLWSTSIVFPAGHSIRIAVSSSNWPRFDVNPNTGEPFRQATGELVAHNTIWHSASHPSRVLLPVVDRSAFTTCASVTEVPDLRVTKATAGAIRLTWGSAEADPCHRRYRVYASDDPSSWSWFVRNPIAEPQSALVETPADFTYWLVVSEGLDGSNGPVGHFGR